MTPDRPSEALRRLMEAGEAAALVRIVRAVGSTPRETGAAMLVTDAAILGTVGGGRLEWEAAARARALLAGGQARVAFDMVLGPSSGQCCGGQVSLEIVRVDRAVVERMAAEERRTLDARPAALLFGAGHVGRALAAALAPLPLRLRWIDARAEEFGAAVPDGVTTVVSGEFAAEIAAAPAGAVCLVLTHSHALDSLIVAAALERDDFAYVGLIGSRGKRRRFERGFRDLGLDEARIGRLVCPIGAGFVRDKRPEVIAAFAAAEVLQASLIWQATRAGPADAQRAA